MDDDAALVLQVLAGNHDAYAQLVLRYAGRVFALCHARVGHVEVAEELAQETLMRGLDELPSLADPSRFAPWLAETAAHTCQDYLQARQAGARGSAQGLGKREEPNRLLQAIDALPEECRSVYLLARYQEATYKDIAQLLDVSTATVNARMTRARALLRQSLNGGTDAAGPR